MKLYTLEEVQKEQMKGFSSSHGVYSPYLDKFILINISVERMIMSFINQCTEPLPNDEDESIVEKLIKKIEEGVKLSPIVIDEDFYLLDGFHRLMAYHRLGMRTTRAYKCVSNENERLSVRRNKWGTLSI
jgi:hypothetical protein